MLAVEQPKIDKANVKAVTRFNADVPPVMVDRQLLKQALMNLLVNAVDAMPGGGRLCVSLERRGEMAGIEIEDTGRGIAPENVPADLQLFYDEARGQRNPGWPALSELCNCSMVR